MAAALPVIMPATAAAPRGGSLVALAVGLVALVTGVALLLIGLRMPDSLSDAIAVPRLAVNRTGNVRFDAAPGASEVTEDPRFRFTAMTQLGMNDHAEPETADDRTRLAQSGPGIVNSDLRRKTRRPRRCAGTNEDSAHLATVPVCWDLQESLVEMAAAHYREPWTQWDGTGAVAAQAASAVAAEAVPAAAETVLVVERFGPPQSGRGHIYSRIALRPHARWETDLEAEPLTLFVQHGRVGVVLDAGSGRVELPDLLLGKRSEPVLPGRRTVLWPGDRLVVSGGHHLRVDNDDATLAIISGSRVQTPPPSVSIEAPCQSLVNRPCR